MPTVSVFDMTGKKVSDMELAANIFGIEPSIPAMHLCVVAYLANQRQGTQSTLTRSEVSGGGKKPWRQKGTGRARQGSTRAPQWYHGGISHGPKPRKYHKDVNKKVRRLAIKSALSDKVMNESLIVLDELKLEAYKTRTVVDCLAAIGATGKTLIVLDTNDAFVVKSAANIKGTKTAQYNTVNTYDIINADKVVMVKAAVEKIEEVYA
jgi:large subunit ribosomal protein L4